MDDKLTDVLYQKLGQKWYVFAQFKGELIYAQLPLDFHPGNKGQEVMLCKIIQEWGQNRIFSESRNDAGTEI